MSFTELRRLLNETAALLEEGAINHADRIAARTAQLARTFERVDAEGTRNALVFRLGSERYAWPVENVRSIGELPHVTPVPFAPAHYRGVISLRGQVLSVLDLRVYLGLPPVDTPPNMIIVIGDGAAESKLEIGVLADDVHDMTPFMRAEVTASVSDLITGITAEGVSLLDADALLAREWRRAQGVIENDR